MKRKVVVVGGGPAGGFCAYNLAKRGINVVLLEKKNRNRYKTCAGGISPRTRNLLGKIPNNIIEREIDCHTFFSKNHTFSISCETLNSNNVLYTKAATVHRTNFDSWLINKAESEGAEIFEREPIIDLQLHSDFAEVTTKRRVIKGDVLIIACGTASFLHKKLNIKPPTCRITIAKELSLSEEVVNERFSGLEFYLNSEASTSGYFWIFPKKEGVSIGLGAALNDSKGLKQTLTTLSSKHPIISKKLEGAKDIKIGGVCLSGHLIPMTYLNKLHGDRYLLLGDSAGLVNAVTGEGIYYSLQSGKLAAETIEKSYEVNDFSSQALQRYTESCYNKLINTDLYWALKLSKMLHGYSPVFFDIFMDALFDLAQENITVGGLCSDIFWGAKPFQEIYNTFMSKKGLLASRLGNIGMLKVLRQASKDIPGGKI